MPRMRGGAAGVSFLHTPDPYYEVIDARIPDHGENVAKMRELRILIDADLATGRVGGLGDTVSAEGRGSDARVQANFGAQGMKWLALEYAKLTPQ